MPQDRLSIHINWLFCICCRCSRPGPAPAARAAPAPGVLHGPLHPRVPAPAQHLLTLAAGAALSHVRLTRWGRPRPPQGHAFCAQREDCHRARDGG